MNRVAKLAQKVETLVAAGLYLVADVISHRHQAPK